MIENRSLFVTRFYSVARAVCRSLKKKKAIPSVPAGHVAPTLSSGSCKEYIMLR